MPIKGIMCPASALADSEPINGQFPCACVIYEIAYRTSPSSSHHRTSTMAAYTIQQLHELEDDELVQLAKRGERRAFDVLVIRHSDRLRRVLLNAVGTKFEQDVYDAAQNAFYKAYANLSKFKGESSFYAWLYKIALNEFKTIIRKIKPGRTTSIHEKYDDSDKDIYEPEDASYSGDPLASTDREIIRVAVHKAMSRLSDKLRMVVELVDIEGHTPGEVARLLNIPAATVRTRLHNGRSQLQELLEKVRDEYLTRK